MDYANIQDKINNNESNNKRLAGRQDSNIKAALLNVNSAYVISLKEVATSFFEPATLREVLDAEIDVIDRKNHIKNTSDAVDKKGNKINKTDANQVTKQPRFYLYFGNFYGLENLVKKKEGLYDIKLHNNLTTFIANSFETPDTEKKSIEEAIKNNNNRCYIIVDRKVKKIKSNTKDENLQDKADEEYCYKDVIVAAAVCQFQKTGCYLLWFATTSKKKIVNQVRQKGYGTLILAILQTCQEIIHSNNSVICQANVTASVGFYLQNHFEIIKDNDNTIYQSCKEYLKKIKAWIKHPDLLLLKSRAKVNILHTWMYENTEDAEVFNKYILPQLVEVYLPSVVTLGHRSNVNIHNLNNIVYGIDPKAKIESFEWNSVLPDDLQEDTNDILFASNSTLEQLVEVDNCTNQILEVFPELLPSHESHDHTENLFYIMSQILYDNNDHENDARCILGFIYNCFSVLSEEHPFLKHDTTTSKTLLSENLQSFNVAKDLIERLQDVYENEQLSKILGLTDKKSIFKPMVLKKAFKLLKCHIIPYGHPSNVTEENDVDSNVTIRGYPMDIVLFSNLIYPRIFLLSAQTHQSHDVNYNQRLWQAHLRHVPKLSCITYENVRITRDQDHDIIYLIGHSHNNQFQLFRMGQRLLKYNADVIYLKSNYRAKFYGITDYETIYQKTNEWLQETRGKYFQNRENMFSFNHFESAGIKISNYLPIVRMIDPLKRIVNFFDGKHYAFTCGLNIKEFLAFYPTAWLQNSALNDFYKFLYSRTSNDTKKVYMIGPVIVKQFNNMKNEQDNNFQKIKTELLNKELICIQINIGQHYITAEVKYDESNQNNCWNIMIADSLGFDDMDLSKFTQIYTNHLTEHGVINFLKLLNPSNKITVSQALHNTLQHNGYDCGVHGARRFYSLWRYNELYPQEECDRKVMEIIPFRLFMLECILDFSDDVSCYVSPTGFGNTFLIPPSSFNNENRKPTSVVGRVTRNGPIRTHATLPMVPDGQLVLDVDKPIDDDDEEAKIIEANCKANSIVNISFDRDLLDGDDKKDDRNDTAIPESKPTDNYIIKRKSKGNKLPTTQMQSQSKANDSIIVPQEIHLTPKKKSQINEHITPQSQILEFTSGDEGSDSSATLSEAGAKNVNPKQSYSSSKMARLSQTLDNESENESTDTESKHSKHSSIKSIKERDFKNDKKQKAVRSSPRKEIKSGQPAKKINIKGNNMPSKQPKSQQARSRRSTTKQRGNHSGISSRPPDKFGNTSGKTLAEESRRVRKVLFESNQATEMAKEWDLDKLNPISNHVAFFKDMDEPTTAMEQLLISNRIKEVNIEKVKKGENELTPAEESNWQRHYYNNAAFLESIQNEVSDDLQKAKATEDKLLKIYLDGKKQHGENDRTTKRKYDRFLKAKVEVTMLQFELKRNPVFHPHNSIYSIRIDDNDVDDESAWNYYVVYKGSNKQFYEAPVAKGWLVENLDPMYMKDLKTHCKARRYILYDSLGAKLTKNFAPYIKFSETDLLKPIYTYKPQEDDVQILKVKAVAIFIKSRKSSQPVFKEKIDWSIYILERKNDGTMVANYVQISNQEMNDIADLHLIEKWKQEMHTWFNEDLNTKKADPSSRVYPTKTRFIDLLDSKNYFRTQYDPTTKKKECTISPLGNFDEGQPYYWETKDLDLYINKTKTQIGGIRYCNKKHIFYGLENDPISKKVTAHVPLTESWVNENFDQRIVKAIKVHANHKIAKNKLYYKVPIGSARETNINNKWINHPPVKFRQHGEGTCTFKSLSSALFYLGFYGEATLIDNMCIEFYSTSKFENNFHRILQEMIQHIRKTAEMKEFKQRYIIKKISSLHDLINFKCHKDDIRLVVLHADDNSVNHAVSVVNGLIFDSNCDNAMTLSFEALTEACNDSNYISICHGYLFEKVIKT